MKIKPKVKKYGKGGSIKDDIININGDYYNNDIIDGLDRDARVLNNQENKFLNRYGVTDRNSFYNKFPTEEIFNFKNGSDKARHYGLSTPYVDETTITLKNGGSINKYPNGGSSIDSLRHQAGKTMDYEFYRGSANGTGLSNYGNPKLNNPTKGDAVDWYMENIAPQLGMFQSAMEKGEAGDFLYNSGKDVRPYAIQEHLKQIDPNNSQNWQDAGGKYKDRKDSTKWDGYWGDIQKLPENQRRQLINKGRDFYYKNINNPSPGVPNDAYDKTWYGRIWNTNDYKEFDPNNPKFIPKKQNGGSIKKYPNGGRQPIIVNDKNDPRLQASDDSLITFNNVQRFNNLVKEYYDKNIGNKAIDHHDELASSINPFNKTPIVPIDEARLMRDKFNQYKNQIISSVENSPYEADVEYESKFIHTPSRFFGRSFADRANPSKYANDFSFEVPLYSFPKPVQPIIYKPSVTTTVGDVIGDKIAKSKDNVAVLNSKLVLKDRPKEPTSELNQEQQLLPETNSQLEFDPIGLKKGTYFTRPRQQQEAGQGKTDYFDSKTGKLLKTMEFGGKTPKYEWNKEDNTKIQPLKAPDYEPYSENINLDSYLKATQLFGDGVSFINPLVGRLISAPGDINDIVKNPKDIKNYITPLLPAVSKVGVPLKQAAKIDRFNTFLTGVTSLSDLPEDTWQTPKKEFGGNITRESNKPIKYGYGGSVSYKDFKKKYKDL